MVSSGHCDFFAHAGIEQCSIEDASDGTKREAFSRLLGLGALGIEERIYDSEKDLLTDRGVDAIRISFSPWTTRAEIDLLSAALRDLVRNPR